MRTFFPTPRKSLPLNWISVERSALCFLAPRVSADVIGARVSTYIFHYFSFTEGQGEGAHTRRPTRREAPPRRRARALLVLVGIRSGCSFLALLRDEARPRSPFFSRALRDARFCPFRARPVRSVRARAVGGLYKITIIRVRG